MIWHMCSACWIPKANYMQHMYYSFFFCNNGYTKLFPGIIVIREVLGIKQKEQSKNYHKYAIIPLWLCL